MLAFNHLGNLGRLGNQMFEYAALRGIAAKHGYDWCIPPYNAQSIENYSLHYCFKMEDVDDDRLGFLVNDRYASRKTFSFRSRSFDGCPDDCSLHGFFQSERYFKNAEDIDS